MKENNEVRVIRISDFDEKGLKDNKIVRINSEERFENYNIADNSILIAMTGGTVGKSFLITHIPEKLYLNQRVACINAYGYLININYIYYVIQSPFIKDLINKNKNSTNDNISMDLINNFLIPLPCYNEQNRIIDKINNLNPIIVNYNYKHEFLEKLNKEYKEELKKSILQYAIQGKLVKQDSNDESAEALINKILDEKRELIKIKQIKKENLSVIYKNSTDNQFYEKFDDGKIVNITDEIPFEIPNNWQVSRLGNLIEIARGGSPRPIQSFLTENDNGINWIKIGDTEKGSKYINKTKEKIIPEGMKKSRFVKKGDFILSNSMSFGRPYILNIDGCIHDGWLVLSNIDLIFNKDYLYYYLTSNFVYNQFCGKVSGAVVNNLNSDKVKETIVLIPPIREQKRISNKLEYLLNYIETAE